MKTWEIIFCILVVVVSVVLLILYSKELRRSTNQTKSELTLKREYAQNNKPLFAVKNSGTSLDDHSIHVFTAEEIGFKRCKNEV